MAVEQLTSKQENTVALWLSFLATLFGTAFEFGWNLGVTNVPESYIKCWMQGIITRNRTIDVEFCDDAIALDKW